MNESLFAIINKMAAQIEDIKDDVSDIYSWLEANRGRDEDDD